LKLHEHQAKELLARCGAPVPVGRPAWTVDEAVRAAQDIGLPIVVKAQILAGGRGKAGGVRPASTLAAVEAHARALLGARLVTRQTGPEGQLVRRLLIEEGQELAGAREMYLGVVVDRTHSQPVLMASARGGVSIEETAASDPTAIVREKVHPLAGLEPYQARRVALALGLSGALLTPAADFLLRLCRGFQELDATLVEVNPWLLRADGGFVALDAKVDIDDNALARHPDLAEMRDVSEEPPLEVEAAKHDLNYIKLPGGNIGCMVNGAGLAMATMDIIKLAGGSPANFLDVGGGANADQIRHAFRILMADPDVHAVLVNIFGGILRCDVLAEGIVASARELKLQVPVVVRMKGTNEAQGQAILRASGLAFTAADDMTEAADKAVAAAAGVR
jgi:succinyl-CoA synthetase beta subunit